MSRIPRQNLSQVIVQDFLDGISRGEYRIGDKLPTHQELTQRYDVGHSVVRDAVQRLAAMGFIDVRPGRGSVIVGLDSSVAFGSDTIGALLNDEAVADLFALRRVIEVDTAFRAATAARDEDVLEFYDIHRAFCAALEAGEPVFQLDIDLHRAIARASRRPIYLRVLDELADVMKATRLEARRLDGASERAAIEHASVIDAIRNRDADAAAARMAEHIDSAYETILRVRALR